ncbi:CCA tRNA nucleotidyltransferase 1, mitochondrial-like isoform X1 [Amphibalanus amphitrite]|uniref:CCA tRNA nucleotidyltransferase 1, mitochondrial-like isoform X1 n=2 Tax=Amphibalanus amphitrite TaxID=1232801 RepID=UPI001C9272E2|nr:CCA tRNA nucleotidyltransferase 1, mitochondrial-like isoform X1 [Amphibalanus amphitrite]XP_043188119.1 CCA tRNA nucleotidyltransferase 1, mitochondrial-like isoform X1 [Amphibalanus amphitrite]XP_043188120.1 CCA tRNA nucleotidyltransferase 1, mitochondrial-like isoform X1 [Amphibalanus amphitrite]XP_043188121.1 CCA tRNA nucleotidyltransferase 1, mitochondrial-like isoform X1 [Amphibalanus amphitrite]XP_043188122.1 CCA tRNA nucleotidyltransferase 1, mitochondrial-like isoform X1 [Amphibalan
MVTAVGRSCRLPILLRQLWKPCSRQLPPRRQLLTMQLSAEQLAPLRTPEVTQLAEMFGRHGYELRLAGGAVRDMLSGIVPADLDFATPATPDQMKALFAAEQVRLINTKGEKHGTITARVNDAVNMEVTTLRIDVATDGRHAEVQFTTDWQQDAGRRDLTVNAMFLDLNGTVYDYFNGYEDLQHRRIRFVGDPSTRIQEDYLRILRYFRFFGRLSGSADGHEAAALSAVRENAAGLARISGERIWSELKRILAGRYHRELMLTMLDLGVGPHIGLPPDPDTAEFGRICERMEVVQEPQPITLLAGLLRTLEEMMALHQRLKLSAFERDLGLFIVTHREDTPPPHPQPLRPYQQLLADYRASKRVGKLFIVELLRYRGQHQLAAEFDAWEMPRFPVNGATLKEAGVPVGRHMSRVLDRLRQIWIDTDFQPTEQQLKKHVPAVMEELGLTPTSAGKGEGKKGEVNGTDGGGGGEVAS